MSSRLVAGSAAAAVALLGVVAIAPAASAAGLEVVNPASSDWTGAPPFADTRPGGTFSYTSEFGAPGGFGNGALKMSTTDGFAKVQYFTANEAGVELADINGVSYSSYKSSQSTGQQLQIPTVNMYLDLDGVLGEPVAFAPLIFEPFYTYGVTSSDEWRTWDGSNPVAKYWSTRPIGNIPSFSYLPLANYQAQAPDAIITASGFNLGSGNPGIIGAVDGLTFDMVTGTDTTYDFEPLDGIVVDDDGAGVVGNCNDPTPAFATIQAAVDFASVGNTVNVCAGNYTENVAVNKRLTFLGAQAGNDARIDRTSLTAESVVHGALNANGVSGTTVDGFWFTDNTASTSSLAFVGGSGHTVVNTVITGNLAASVEHSIVYAADGVLPSVFSKNRITNNDQHGIFATGVATNVTISDNAFAGNGSSVVHFAPSPGSGSTGVVVSSNASQGDVNFLVGSGVDNLTISNNSINTTSTGLLFGGDFDNVTLTDNSISGGVGSGVSISSQFAGGVVNTGFTINGNTFTGSQRGISFAAGGYSGTAQVHFNRIVGNSSTAEGRVGIRNLSGGAINAEDNWLGCNEGPSGADCDKTTGAVDADPYLVLAVTVDPNPVTGPATVTADLTRNSAGVDRSAAGTLPPTPVIFAASKGTLTSTTATTVNGVATTTLDPGPAVGNGIVSATVDFETVSKTVTFLTPRLSVGDVTVAEGASVAVFTVSLDMQSDAPVTFQYATSAGTATATADYTSVTAGATILAGQTSVSIAVPVTQDQLDEADETFTVTISNASVVIADDAGIGTITDDDATPTVSILDLGTIIEGTDANFEVKLNVPSGQLVQVKFLTRDSTAKAPKDYEPRTGITVTFSPGETSKIVAIETRLDRKTEGNEVFGAGLYKPSNVKVSDRAAQVTIGGNST